jgi:uridine monophosphate synthetase
MLLLVPGLGAQGGDLNAALSNGLDAGREGLLLNVSRAIIYDPQPDKAAERWRDDINAIRAGTVREPASGLQGDVGLALALHEAGCIQFGRFRLHSGEESPIYIDLRLLVSFPTLLQRVARSLARLLQGLDYDRIAAIPYAALPIATAVALELNRPLVYARREAKAHGLRRAVEGHFEVGERVVVLDDVVTTGESKLQAIVPLQAVGLRVEDIVVLVDREQGGAERLVEEGYRVHSLWKLSEMLGVLQQHGRISPEQHNEVREWLGR